MKGFMKMDSLERELVLEGGLTKNENGLPHGRT